MMRDALVCSPQRPATPLSPFFWPELDEFDVDESRSFGRGHEINHLRVGPFALTDHDAVDATSACQLRVLAEPHPPFVACADNGVADVAESWHTPCVWQSRSVTPAMPTPVLASPPVDDEPLPHGDGVASVSSESTNSIVTTCLAHCTLGGQLASTRVLDGPALVEKPLSPETDCSWGTANGSRSVAVQRFDSDDSDVFQLDEPTDEMPVLGMEGIVAHLGPCMDYHACASDSHAHVAAAHQAHSQEQPASCCGNLNTIHSHTVSSAPRDRAGPPPRTRRQRFIRRGDARTAPMVEAEERSTKRKRDERTPCETKTAFPPSNDNTSPPHSKRVTGRRQLEESFHLSREEAAARLGCGITHFKQQCRAFGVKKWPRRQVRALMQAQARLEEHQKFLRPVRCARTDEALQKVAIWQRQVREPNTHWELNVNLHKFTRAAIAASSKKSEQNVHE